LNVLKVDKKREVVDALIIGAGPAGLMAAVYLARFRRAVTLIDAGASRAALIPSSHNFPAFAEGVAEGIADAHAPAS
jgi:thioredoxin reductase (NADPH)